jgi:hypothetical protein
VSVAIRVMFEEMPKMLREIIEHALGEATDVEVLDPQLARADAGTAPDVVLLGTDGPHSLNAASVLARYPRARVIAIETSGRHTAVYELKPHRIEVGQLSPAGVVELIRTTVRGATGRGSLSGHETRRH